RIIEPRHHRLACILGHLDRPAELARIFLPENDSADITDRQRQNSSQFVNARPQRLDRTVFAERVMFAPRRRDAELPAFTRVAVAVDGFAWLRRSGESAPRGTASHG